MADLIYTDANRIDQDVIPDYELDFAYGTSENNFELTVDAHARCVGKIKTSCWIYLEGTEYGGVIDAVNPNSEDGFMRYSGRTLHGIINGKVLGPDPGQDYLQVSGEGNAVLRYLVDRMGLSDVVTVSTDVSTITIHPYTFKGQQGPPYSPYVYGYVGILDMLYANQAKLEITMRSNFYTLGVVPLYDWEGDEEWDNSKVTFSAKLTGNFPNHMVCLGPGELKDRYKIHLFADRGKGIQPYATTANPIHDSDYILDERNKKLLGSEEITVIYEDTGAAVKANYVQATTMPANWDQVFGNYFTRKVNEDLSVSWSRLEIKKTTVYTLLSAQPADWATNYGSYYKRGQDSADGTPNYNSVNGVDGTPVYTLLQGQPDDWAENYQSYLVKTNDGTQDIYKPVASLPEDRYHRQTVEPTDWTTAWKSYYNRGKVTRYRYKHKTRGVHGVWVTEYVDYDTQVADIKNDREVLTFQKAVTYSHTYFALTDAYYPAWKARKRYTKETVQHPGVFVAGAIYQKYVPKVAPAFAASTYYKKTEDVPKIPAFNASEQYLQVLDHYADLVGSAIKKFEALLQLDTIKIDLPDDLTEYDINDIVGATDSVYNITVSSRILKKVVKINTRKSVIQYTTG